MKKMYGLQNDKENINLTVGDDKAWITIQTAEGFEARELNLQYDNEDLGVISADKVKPINISADKITTGTLDAGKGKVVNLDGTGEKIEIKVGELRTQTTFLMSKVDYLETKLKEKDEEISKLKDLTNTKVSSEEFWDSVKYYTEESDALAEVEPIDITEYYKGGNDKDSRIRKNKSKKDSIKKLFGMHNPNYVFKDVSVNSSGNIVYDDDGYIGVKTDSKNDKGESQQKEQPEPLQKALKRIKELNRVTDVRIDEEFKATDLNMTENRLTITIDYLENNH